MTQLGLFPPPAPSEVVDWAACPPCCFGEPLDPVTWARGFHCRACERFATEAIAHIRGTGESLERPGNVGGVRHGASRER